MAVLTFRIQRTQPSADTKRGEVTIVGKATGNLLAKHAEGFPSETADDYILEVLLQKGREMMRQLAMKQVPPDFSFDIESDQMRLKRLFDL